MAGIQFQLNDDNYYMYNSAGANFMETNGPVGLISLPGTEEFVQKVDRHLYNLRMNTVQKYPSLLTNEPGFMRNNFMVNTEITRFASGEGKATLHDTVRGHDLYIFSDVTNHYTTYKMFQREVPMSPDEHFQNIKRVILAASNKARRISVVMPYLYQGLQDIRTSRESLDAANMLKELNRMGVQVIMTFDPHEPRVENAIPLYGIENIPTSYSLLKSVISENPDIDFNDPEQTIIISPDEKGMKRATYYASMLGLQVGTFFRERDFSTRENGENPIVNFNYLGNDLEGKTAVIIDDIVFSGETVTRTAKTLKEELGAKNVLMLATYPLLTNGLAPLDEAYNNGHLHRLYGTNLTAHSEEMLARPWYRDVDMSNMTAELIDALNHQASISGILDQSSQIAELLHRSKEQRLFNNN